MVPLEQTDCDVGEATTPLKEFTFIALDDPLPGVAVRLPQGFIAFTLIICEPVGDADPTDTETELEVPPEIIVQPFGKFHW